MKIAFVYPDGLEEWVDVGAVPRVGDRVNTDERDETYKVLRVEWQITGIGRRTSGAYSSARAVVHLAAEPSPSLREALIRSTVTLLKRDELATEAFDLCAVLARFGDKTRENVPDEVAVATVQSNDAANERQITVGHLRRASRILRDLTNLEQPAPIGGKP